MSLWLDQYRPQSFEDLKYNTEQGALLKKIVAKDDFPHLLFHGPDGAGKHTFVRCALREIFGPGAAQLKHTKLEFETAGGKAMKIDAVDSLHHIEVRPSDVGFHDRIIVQNVIKQVASQFLSGITQKTFKVVVIHEADRLSFDAQQALRRTMERFSGQCKIFLCCSHIHKLIEPLVSRCMTIRLALPSQEKLCDILKYVAKAQAINVSNKFVQNIVHAANCNTRRALLMMEATVCRFNASQQFDQQKIVTADWIATINDIAQKLVESPTISCIQTVRAKFYDLVNSLIPLDIIFEQLLINVSNRLTDSNQKLILSDTVAKYQHMSIYGDKPVVYLEACFLEYFSQIARFN